MRFLSAALLSTAALISQFSLARTPASSNEQIGAVQSAVDFCSKVDSRDERAIERQAKVVLPDMTKARVAAARHTAEFQRAYHAIESVLKGLRVREAVRICKASIQGDHKRRQIQPPGASVQ